MDMTFLKKHRILLLLILSSAIFLALYRRFIFGDAIFMYTDLGSDGMSSSYPIITMLSRLLMNRDFSAFTLESGLGSDTTATFLQYINPLKLFLLVFGRDRFHIGILIFLYIQHTLTALLGYGYFSILLKNKDAAVIPALIWAYASYIVLWGQNYSFGTCILMFTLVMYLLQGAYDTGLKRFYFLLIPALALSLISNYYFYYMIAAFTAVYTFLYTLIAGDRRDLPEGAKRENRILTVVLRLMRLLLIGIFSVVIGAVSVLPIISSFLTSNRTETTQQYSFRIITHPYDLRTYLTFIGRFFSTDLFGTGNAFTGQLNYYEIAILFVSTLFFFSVIYLLFSKKGVLPVVLLTALCAVMLYFRGAAWLLTFNISAQRYSFMICFVEVIAIAFFVRALTEGPGKVRLALSVIIAPAGCAAVLYGLHHYAPLFNFDLSRRAVIIAAGSVALYALLLFLQIFDKIRGGVRVLLVLAVCAELVIANSASLYERDYVTREEYASSLYNDGTQKAAEYLSTLDNSLYRINASTEYNYANEGMVDGFNSTTSYSSVNPASLHTLSRAHRVNQLSDNFFIVSYDDYYLFTLLSGKYLITDNGEDRIGDSMETSLFTQVDVTDTNKTFVNNNSLPFGYLYHDQIRKSAFEELDSFERMKILTQAYYKTNGGDGNISLREYDIRRGKSMALIDKISHINNCSIEKNEDGTFTATAQGEDPFFIMALNDALTDDEFEVQYLHIAVDPAKTVGDGTLQTFILTEAHPDLSDCDNEIIPMSQALPDMTKLLPDRTNNIRVDLSDNSSVTFLDLSLITDINAALEFQDLKATDISDISFENDVYSAVVKNPEESGMLCVPIPYTSGWTATVNGKKVQVQNINGGLCGVEVPKGSCKVKMTYRLPYLELAAMISAGGLAVWFILFILPFGRRKKPKQSVAQ